MGLDAPARLPSLTFRTFSRSTRATNACTLYHRRPPHAFLQQEVLLSQEHSVPIDNERFTICHEKWADMTPSERGRLCAKCNKQIVDFRGKSTAEIERTLAEKPGLCGFYTVTEFRNPTPLIAATAAAALVAGAPVVVASTVEAQSVTLIQPQAPLAAPVRVHGIVIDAATGGPLVGAQVMALPRFGTITNAQGKFEFTIRTEVPVPFRISALLIGYKGETYEIAQPDTAVEVQFALSQYSYEVTGIVVTGTVPLKPKQERPSFFKRVWRSIRGIS
jgi:CarboxypepD_reg-like domain